MYANRLKRFGCVLAVASAVTSSSTAWSQPPPQGADVAQQADDHFLKAKALMKAGNVRGAYDEYAAAWSLKKTYDTATNLGNIELTLGMPRHAAEHLAFALRNYAVTGVTQDKLDRMKQLFAQARAQVGAVTITVNVDGADVLVDGRLVGRSPIAAEVFVDPGAHALEARLASYGAARTTVTIDKGGSGTATLTLTQTPTAAGSATPPRRPPAALLVTGGVLAAAGLATGIGLTVAANGKAFQVDQLQSGNASGCFMAGSGAASRCTSLHDAATSKATLSNAAVSSFIAAGAFGLATAGLGIWAAVVPKGNPVRVAPTVGADRVGVVVQGVW